MDYADSAEGIEACRKHESQRHSVRYRYPDDRWATAVYLTEENVGTERRVYHRSLRGVHNTAWIDVEWEGEGWYDQYSYEVCYHNCDPETRIELYPVTKLLDMQKEKAREIADEMRRLRTILRGPTPKAELGPWMAGFESQDPF